MKYFDIVADKSIANSKNLIYRFTNVVNNKIYIGITTSKFIKRIQSHISQSNPKTRSKKGYFQKALHFYGINNFNIDIIEYLNSESELFEREIFWIDYYKSSDSKFGYNLTFGGDGNRSNSQTSEKTREKISIANKSKWAIPEYRETRITQMNSSKNKRIPIVQLDLSYNVINRFESLKDVKNIGFNSICKLHRQTIVCSGTSIWMKESSYSKLELGNPVICELDKYGSINYYYSFVDANKKIASLCNLRNYNSLKINLNSKKSKSFGFEKGGSIWSLYELK